MDNARRSFTYKGCLHIKMAKEYHGRTAKNPFAGGPKPTIWPHGMGGAGKMVTLGVPRLLREKKGHELMRIYAQFLAGNLTKEETLKEFNDILSHDYWSEFYAK